MNHIRSDRQMLIRFAVENYNSFKERQVFSMAAGRQTRHTSHCLLVDGKRLLKSSFFFGANASGKSNFVRAIDFMRRVTIHGTETINYSDKYFRVDPEYKEHPGVFQIDFIAKQKVYSYGFAINYITHTIVAEWLYHIDSNEKEVCIFEREEGNEVRCGLPLERESATRFRIYCEDLKKDELLLNVIGNKNLPKETGLADITYAFKWFGKLIVVYPDSHPRHKTDFFLNPAYNSEALAHMLRVFDTGIENITKGKQPAEKAFSFLPEEVKKDILDDILHGMYHRNRETTHCMIEIGDYQFEMSIEDGELYAEKIMLDHGNSSDLFELSDESDGTRRLFDLIPLYEFGQKEKIIIVDELDRSFHSKLTENFIQLFFLITKNKPSQLICTTHDLNLMDLKTLRQDEIWFVERLKDHSTKIYSLSDYKQRFDKNVLNDYLLGRYGAIPCFQDTDWQVEDE